MIYIIRLLFLTAIVLGVMAFREEDPFIAGCICGAGGCLVFLWAVLKVLIWYWRNA